MTLEELEAKIRVAQQKSRDIQSQLSCGPDFKLNGVVLTEAEYRVWRASAVRALAKSHGDSTRLKAQLGKARTAFNVADGVNKVFDLTTPDGLLHAAFSVLHMLFADMEPEDIEPHEQEVKNAISRYLVNKTQVPSG